MDLKLLTQAEQVEHYNDTGAWEDHHWMIEDLITDQAKVTLEQAVAMFDKELNRRFSSMVRPQLTLLERYQKVIEELRAASVRHS